MSLLNIVANQEHFYQFILKVGNNSCGQPTVAFRYAQCYCNGHSPIALSIAICSSMVRASAATMPR